MASSCLGQVAGPTTTVSSKSFSISLKNPRINTSRICLNSSFVSPFLNASSGLRKAAIPRRSNVIIAADTLTSTSETAEVEPDVASDVAEAPIVEVEQTVEVEQSEAPAATGSKSRKTKGLKNIMQTLHQRAIEAASEGKDIPDIRVGDIVQLRVEVPQNKKRISLLRGIVIGRQNAGIHTTFRIRRVIAGVGVEMVFPLYSPNIKEIKVVNSRKVRRAKLYYLRDKLARLSSV